jgi:putative transposase
MTDYRRFYIPNATWFFTVNWVERGGNRLLVDKIDVLRHIFTGVKQKHPFRMDAVVVLPDHLHCLWVLPPGDTNFSERWGLIKAGFSRTIEKGERVSVSRKKRGERGIWQRRFWDHMIRDDVDYQRHFNYIHWNPVKHNLVRHVADWPYSSFHAYVEKGVYSKNWGGCVDGQMETSFGE